MSEDLARINFKLESLESSMVRMEQSVTRGMDKISTAMEQVAVVMSKAQENQEDHKIIHQRIDQERDAREELRNEFTELQTNYSNCCGQPKPRDPVKTSLVTALALIGLTAFLALIMTHAKELTAIIFGH